MHRPQVVCDGMYSALRKKLSAPRIAHPSYFVGLLLRNCSLPHANFGHVVLAKPSPILFYPISSTEVGQREAVRLRQSLSVQSSVSHLLGHLLQLMATSCTCVWRGL